VSIFYLNYHFREINLSTITSYIYYTKTSYKWSSWCGTRHVYFTYVYTFIFSTRTFVAHYFIISVFWKLSYIFCAALIYVQNKSTSKISNKNNIFMKHGYKRLIKHLVIQKNLNVLFIIELVDRLVYNCLHIKAQLVYSSKKYRSLKIFNWCVYAFFLFLEITLWWCTNITTRTKSLQLFIVFTNKKPLSSLMVNFFYFQKIK